MDKFQRSIIHHIQSSSLPNPKICPACGKHFATESGANKHLSQLHKCAWYNKNKYEDLIVYPDTEDYSEDLPNDDNDVLPPILDDTQLDNNINLEHEEEETINIHHINASSIPQSTSTEDIEKTSDLFYKEYPDAGKILGIQETAQQQWNEAVSPTTNTNLFHLFESELD